MLEDPVVQKNNAVWALKRLLKMEQELANGGTHNAAADGQPGPANPGGPHVNRADELGAALDGNGACYLVHGFWFDEPVGVAVFEAVMQHAAAHAVATNDDVEAKDDDQAGEDDQANEDTRANDDNQLNKGNPANEENPADEPDMPEPAHAPESVIQEPTGLDTVLHGIQYNLQHPNININLDQDPQQPERDMQWEREEAEQAHDDALRAAEYLIDFPPLGPPHV
jgi:hypothetical protein